MTPTAPLPDEELGATPQTEAAIALLRDNFVINEWTNPRQVIADRLTAPEFVAALVAVERQAAAAALRAERTAPLDVERLARAQLRAGIDTFRPRDDKWISANEAQAAIAAEYARLAPATEPPASFRPHPGENHAFRMQCQTCGKPGFVNLQITTADEIIRIEDRPAPGEGEK